MKMNKTDTPRGLLNQELQTVEWSQCNTQAVLHAANYGGYHSMKSTMKLALTLTLALALLITTALAATLLFSPRYDALQLADQALLKEYGITEEMQPGLHHTVTEENDAAIITYQVQEHAVMRENRFGVYTVTIADGKADAVWSLDSMNTAGGLDAPAWGAEQLLMYVKDYSEVMTYMESHDMLMNAVMATPAPNAGPSKWEQDKATALSMAQITLDNAAAIARNAIVARYDLRSEQSSLLVRYTDEDEYNFMDESTYEVIEGLPLVNLFFHLSQQPGEWQEKDGTYVVTVNLLDGTVEDIFYDTGLIGNG